MQSRAAARMASVHELADDQCVCVGLIAEEQWREQDESKLVDRFFKSERRG